MTSNKILPVILCGGSGTRLWPKSRKSYPKQFLNLNFSNRKSLLQRTQIRISNLKNLCDPIFICNEEHRFIVAEQIRELSIKPNSIILEPFGRNTAPAITIAALKSLEIGEDLNLLILSSDHQIENEKKFIEVIEEGVKYSQNGDLVTFGICPDSPKTGYGYIKSLLPLDKSIIKGSKIDCFIEKPNKDRAIKLIKDSRYTWNSGIFLFKASSILKEIKNFSPEILDHCKSSLNNHSLDLDFQRLEEKSFKKCPNISIDLAVMEKTDKGFVLPLNVGWSDIGSWDSVWKISKKDKEGNVLEGKVITKKTSNTFLSSESRLIAAIGLQDLVVVETSDAILVANKECSQDIKDLVCLLKEKNISQGIEHVKNYRPWGHYLSLINESNWQVKLIKVKPREKLSLQKHQYRSEHWVVVKGIAKVEIEEKEMMLKENQSAYIPIKSKHRLSNPGDTDLKIIEIQTGSYIGEDDIERFEDDYGRLN